VRECGDAAGRGRGRAGTRPGGNLGRGRAGGVGDAGGPRKGRAAHWAARLPLRQAARVRGKRSTNPGRGRCGAALARSRARRRPARVDNPEGSSHQLSFRLYRLGSTLFGRSVEWMSISFRTQPRLGVLGAGALASLPGAGASAFLPRSALPHQPSPFVSSNARGLSQVTANTSTQARGVSRRRSIAGGRRTGRFAPLSRGFPARAGRRRGAGSRRRSVLQAGFALGSSVSPRASMPAPTVSLVASSIRMKLPVRRLRS